MTNGLLSAPSNSFPTTPTNRSRRYPFKTLWLGGLAIVVLIVLGSFFLLGRGLAEPFTGPIWTVSRQKLQLTITERGALESAENSEIFCRVKSGAKGSGAATTIKWVIEDGTHVKRGQKLVELDQSGLETQLQEQSSKVDKARAGWIKAEANVLITQSQNHSDIEDAKIKLNLAQLNLQKYVGVKLANILHKFPEKELDGFWVKLADIDLGQLLSKEEIDQLGGEYIQMRNDLEGKIETARSEREMWLDRAAWSQRMSKRGYMAKSQAEADRMKLESTEFALKKVSGELDTLKRFLLKLNVVDLLSKVREGERALERNRTQAKSKEDQALAELKSERSIFLREENIRLDLEEELKKCIIYSPQDGLVIHYIPEQFRSNSGSQQSIVAQGEPVREGQKLMRIPDLSKMLVQVRVHEAMMAHLRAEVVRLTGLSQTHVAGLWLTTHPLERMAGLLALTEVYNDLRAQDQEEVYKGQSAIIRVDAFPNRHFQGHVKLVANVASSIDWWSDVKVYQTVVGIDGTVAHLKPGMSAEVTIFADESPEPVLVIPIQSVVGTIAMGKQRKCFVLDAAGQPQERDILLGMCNEKMVEVQEGLAEGDKVVLNPRPLLVADKAHLKPSVPSGKRGSNNLEPGAEEKGTKARKGQGKDKGLPPPDAVEPGSGSPAKGPRLPTQGLKK